jgi:hypothetical protein
MAAHTGRSWKAFMLVSLNNISNNFYQEANAKRTVMARA